VKPGGRWLKATVCAAVVVLLFLLPLLVSNLYYIGVLTTILTSALLAASLWLILMTGQVSLGHGGFAAIGGFISAAFVTAYGINSWAALVIACACAAVVGLLIGYITLRIKGVYFIIATLALGESISIGFGMWDHPFGGLHGIMGIPVPDAIPLPGGHALRFESNVALYLLTLVLVLVALWIIHRVYAGRIGHILRSISQSDELAENVGVNTMRYKVLAFVVGCTCAGLAGVLYTYSTRYISPSTFNVGQSAFYLLCVTVGGGTSIAGPIIGAAFLGLFGEIIRPAEKWQPIIFGLLLIVCVLYFKLGLLGVFEKTRYQVVRLVRGSVSKGG
jgi:branched-chain amino acid transport system permease protein